MHENAIPFWHYHSTRRSGCVSLINEVSKKPPNNEANSERKVEPRAEAVEDMQKAPLLKLVSEKCVHIGSDLAEDKKDRLLVFLHENQDVFT